MNLYKLIHSELDEYVKNQDKIREMRKETNLKQIFTEITQNTNFKIFTIENSKYIKERRKNSETKFISNLFSQREQIIIKSRDLLPFNQTSFRTVTHFFQKQNESELISSMITEKVSNVN